MSEVERTSALTCAIRLLLVNSWIFHTILNIGYRSGFYFYTRNASIMMGIRINKQILSFVNLIFIQGNLHRQKRNMFTKVTLDIKW